MALKLVDASGGASQSNLTRELAKFPEPVRARFRSMMRSYAAEPKDQRPDFAKLSSLKGLREARYKYRGSQYRLFFAVTTTEVQMLCAFHKTNKADTQRFAKRAQTRRQNFQRV